VTVNAGPSPPTTFSSFPPDWARLPSAPRPARQASRLRIWAWSRLLLRWIGSWTHISPRIGFGGAGDPLGGCFVSLIFGFLVFLRFRRRFGRRAGLGERMTRYKGDSRPHLDDFSQHRHGSDYGASRSACNPYFGLRYSKEPITQAAVVGPFELRLRQLTRDKTGNRAICHFA
jgi:hypothetical protein